MRSTPNVKSGNCSTDTIITADSNRIAEEKSLRPNVTNYIIIIPPS